MTACSDAEVKALWSGTREHIPDIRPSMVAALRIQLLTGARIGEVLAMGWTDLNKERSTWLIPSAIALGKCSSHRFDTFECW